MALKRLGEKSCEIKGGGQEMAAMMLMLINFNNGCQLGCFCVDSVSPVGTYAYSYESS